MVVPEILKEKYTRLALDKSIFFIPPSVLIQYNQEDIASLVYEKDKYLPVNRIPLAITNMLLRQDIYLRVVRQI